MTDFGRLCSGANVQKVSSLKQCKGYAAFMAKKHSRFSFKGTEETSVVPKGCYILQGGSFYWNTHSTGSAHSMARHVCKKFGKVYSGIFRVK